MLYNMPQKGTTVSLYMPNHDERSGMVINSIRQNTSEDMTDPSKRTFTTQHDKKLDLYPSQMKLQSKTTGTTVGLEDEYAIFIASHKNINIIAKEEILLKAKVINIEAKEELNLTKGDALSGIVESSITQSTEIDKKAKTKTQVIGTDKEEYPQIEDAPPEEEFDWKKLGKNVLAGLAVVGAVALTLATFGAAGAVIVGAAIGGGLAVGLTAVGDIARGEVSSKEEYIFAGFTGAVTGAISGRIDASALKVGEKLLAEAGLGFVLGGIEDATRQVVIEGKEKVDLGQSVMNGIKNAGLAIAVPLVIKGISKGIQAVLNKINTPGVNTVVGKVAEKGSKIVGNNANDVISNGAGKVELSRMDYLRNKYGKLTPEQINNRINLRGATHDKLNELLKSGKTNKQIGPAVAGVMDTKTGKIYYVVNNPKGKPPKIMDDLIKDRIENMPENIRKSYIKTKGAGSHAEINALNEALLSRKGATIDDFMIHVISTKNLGPSIPQAGIPMPRCPHCEFITYGANYFPEVLKYGNKNIR